ncbi:MAG: GNAT family N-acetyltransferase [Leptothrix sp. (in: b-proteobacteria)]
MAYRVLVCDAAEITDAQVRAWLDLESVALEPNAYLSPHFVLPALKHLEPEARIKILLVERQTAGGQQLVGLGVFRVMSGTRRFPLPHLSAYLSAHSYLSGLLLDRTFASDALDAMFGHVRSQSWRWHGITFERGWGDGPQAQLISDYAQNMQRTLRCLDEQSRAVLHLPLDHAAHQTRLSSSLTQNIKRRTKRLNEQGAVNWRAHRQAGVPDAAVEAFLALEHQGWKGESGTSLRSAASHEAFFKDVVGRFAAEGRAMFTEMTVNDQVIVSTSNFVSGNAGFAFKVGWNSEYAKMSPGVLCEAEFLRAAGNICPDLNFFDSGASPGSYMDDIWPDRRIVNNSCLALSTLGKLAIDAVDAARAMKERHAAAPIKPAATCSAALNTAQ